MTPLTENEIRDRLAPLRDLEPTHAEVARARVAAAPEPLARRRRRRRGPVLALGAAAAAAVAMALPVGDTGGAADALRTAAATAAERPGPADFSGYRYVDVRDRRLTPWALPDAKCLRPAPAPGDPAPAPAPGCDPGTWPRATFRAEGRQEIWVDARWQGVRRDHGSRVTAATGDPELAAALRAGGGRDAVTEPFEYGDGPWAEIPLHRLPPEPGALLEELRAAHDDGRWSTRRSGNPDADTRRYELAQAIVQLLAESNATPELRSAGFGALARLERVADLGEVEDPAGRRGHGIEVRASLALPEGRVPASVRLVFDTETSEVLSWATSHGEGGTRSEVERVLMATGHVEAVPPAVRRAARDSR